MSGVTGIAAPVADSFSGIGRDQGAQGNRTVQGEHSQFRTVSVGPASASFLEEASITLSSLRKFENKDDKKNKELGEALERLKQTVPDLPPLEALDKLLAQLQDAGEKSTLTGETIKELARQYSDDPTHQYQALEALADHARAQGDQVLADTLSEYTESFYRDNKQDIQAGLNVSQAASQYAEQSGYGSVQELRDVWRTGLNVPDFQTVIEAYQHAEQQFGYDEVEKGIEWLRKALSTELGAMTASVDATHLNHVRKRLEVVYGLNSAIELCKQYEEAIVRLVKSDA